MAQLPFVTLAKRGKSEIFELGRRPPQFFTSTEQRALTRIGYEKEPDEELNWFIRLGNAKLEGLSEGEVLMLQEEFNALDKAHSNSPYRYDGKVGKDGYFQIIEVPCLPTLKEMVEVQKIIQSRLSELADLGYTCLPEMPTQMNICYPRRMEKTDLPSYIPECAVSHFVTSPSLTKLVYFMGHLLEKVGKLVLRCPHCRNIFLQSRKNQEYCSRSCQSVAVMQRRRTEAKVLQVKSRSTRNRRARHGTKRR